MKPAFPSDGDSDSLTSDIEHILVKLRANYRHATMNVVLVRTGEPLEPSRNNRNGPRHCFAGFLDGGDSVDAPHLHQGLSRSKNSQANDTGR